MPLKYVTYFKEANGTQPLWKWLRGEKSKELDAKVKSAVLNLIQAGLSIDRPAAGMLRDGIRELRIRHNDKHYRLLFFFHQEDTVIAGGGKDSKFIAVITHGFIKKTRDVPEKEIDKAIRMKDAYVGDPEKHGKVIKDED